MGTKKHDNKTTNIILFVLIAVSIGIGVNANMNEEPISVDPQPQILANIGTLISHEQDIKDMKQANYVNLDNVQNLKDKYMNLIIAGDLYLTADDLKELEARVLIAENAITTLSANRMSVPTHSSTTLDFNLVLLNLDSIQQDTYSIGDIVYITGNAGVSETQELSMKIRAPNSEVIIDKGFSIPSEGRFTSVYIIPSGSPSGTYTITVSGGSVLETISFDIE